jgi:hypothetical protein
MKVHYFTTEQEPGITRIDVVYQEEPPTSTPAAADVLFYAMGNDAEDAKANLLALAKDHGEEMVEEARARAEGVRLAVRELTT